MTMRVSVAVFSGTVLSLVAVVSLSGVVTVFVGVDLANADGSRILSGSEALLQVGLAQSAG